MSKSTLKILIGIILFCAFYFLVSMVFLSDGSGDIQEGIFTKAYTLFF